MRASEVFEHSDRVLDVDEVDGVHDMRVATRRLRAAIEVFAPCFPRKRYRRALKQVKALADALGARRDPDVQLDLLSELMKSAATDRTELEALAEQLRGEQLRANEELAGHIRGKGLGKLELRLRRLVEAAQT